MSEGTYTFVYWGLSHPNFAIQMNSGHYLVSDYGNNRIIELDFTLLVPLVRSYIMAGVVYFDYSEANETLLIASETLNIVREVTWSDMDFGTTIWQSSYSLNSPQCATYKKGDTTNIVIADIGNGRIVKCNRTSNAYESLDYYRLDSDDTSTVHEISSFYKPYRVFQYADGNICVVEQEGRPIDFGTLESSSSSSTEVRSSSSSI